MSLLQFHVNNSRFDSTRSSSYFMKKVEQARLVNNVKLYVCSIITLVCMVYSVSSGEILIPYLTNSSLR